MVNPPSFHVVGIDPGLKGGIAVLDPSGKLTVRPMPVRDSGAKEELDPDGLRAPFSTMDAVRVFVERVGPFPGASSSSSFTFGKVVGQTHTVLWSLGVTPVLVEPKAWQGKVRGKVGRDKAGSIRWVRENYPGLAEVVGTNDGMAEAVLIAEYGRRLLKGEI